MIFYCYFFCLFFVSSFLFLFAMLTLLMVALCWSPHTLELYNPYSQKNLGLHSVLLIFSNLPPPQLELGSLLNTLSLHCFPISPDWLFHSQWSLGRIPTPLRYYIKSLCVIGKGGDRNWLFCLKQKKYIFTSENLEKTKIYVEKLS